MSGRLILFYTKTNKDKPKTKRPIQENQYWGAWVVQSLPSVQVMI